MVKVKTILITPKRKLHRKKSKVAAKINVLELIHDKTQHPDCLFLLPVLSRTLKVSHLQGEEISIDTEMKAGGKAEMLPLNISWRNKEVIAKSISDAGIFGEEREKVCREHVCG